MVRQPMHVPGWARVVAVLVFAPIVLLVAFIAAMKWRMLQPDATWAKAAMRDGDALATRIEAYRDATASLPPDLETLADAHSSGAGAPSLVEWRYTLQGGGASYELSATHGRWVSAFDKLVLRSDRTIPREWKESDAKLVEYGDWVYIVAAELLPPAR